MRHWSMTISGRLAAVVALAASAMLLAACTAAPDHPLIDDRERATIRSHILNDLWGPVASQYPEAIRPVVSVARTVPNHEWAQTVVDCLRGQGITAGVVGGGVSYLSSSGQTQLEYAVANYTCSAQYPSESAVVRLLTPALAEADYRYQVTVVRPCLLIAGAPSPASPNRELADSINSLGRWNPFQVIWAGNYPRGAVRYWEQRCPPVPVWLDVAG
jgi:hypothetical protein